MHYFSGGSGRGGGVGLAGRTGVMIHFDGDGRVSGGGLGCGRGLSDIFWIIVRIRQLSFDFLLR